MSASVGIMRPVVSGARLNIMDQFFLGGPLTLRGFNINGVGPHEDGSSDEFHIRSVIKPRVAIL